MTTVKELLDKHVPEWALCTVCRKRRWATQVRFQGVQMWVSVCRECANSAKTLTFPESNR